MGGATPGRPGVVRSTPSSRRLHVHRPTQTTHRARGVAAHHRRDHRAVAHHRPGQLGFRARRGGRPGYRNYSCWERWGADSRTREWPPRTRCAGRPGRPTRRPCGTGTACSARASPATTRLPSPTASSAAPAHTGTAATTPWTPSAPGRPRQSRNSFRLNFFDQARHGADYIRVYVTKQGFNALTTAAGLERPGTGRPDRQHAGLPVGRGHRWRVDPDPGERVRPLPAGTSSTPSGRPATWTSRTTSAVTSTSAGARPRRRPPHRRPPRRRRLRRRPPHRRPPRRPPPPRRPRRRRPVAAPPPTG